MLKYGSYGKLNVKSLFTFWYVVFVKNTQLVKRPVPVVTPQAEDTPQHDVDTPKQATKDSLDKELLSESFLSYLARHNHVHSQQASLRLS